MYRPAAFDVPELDELHDLLEAGGPAHLVTAGPEGFDASVVPMLLDRRAGPLGTLLGHLARPNRQWSTLVPGSRALAIVPGPDAYVSPSWYPSKAEHGKVVPTWNYVVVHAQGELVVHDDPAWLEPFLRRLTDRHEAALPVPWSIDDTPPGYVAATVRGVVGVELRIGRLEGKRKLSQNRPADVDAVIAQLGAGDPSQQATAAAMQAARRQPPRSEG